VPNGQEIERGVNDRPLRKGKSNARPGVLHGGAKTDADRIKAAVDREVKQQIQAAKREWASEREARLKASPSELASVQDTRAIHDNKERHTMLNPGEMLNRDLPAPFRTPSVSATIKTKKSLLLSGPADELDSDFDKMDEFELEETKEIDVEEPNGMEENEMDEGPIRKVSTLSFTALALVLTICSSSRDYPPLNVKHNYASKLMQIPWTPDPSSVPFPMPTSSESSSQYAFLHSHSHFICLQFVRRRRQDTVKVQVEIEITVEIEILCRRRICRRGCTFSHATPQGSRGPCTHNGHV
jgi:hypothetical protein